MQLAEARPKGCPKCGHRSDGNPPNDWYVRYYDGLFRTAEVNGQYFRDECLVLTCSNCDYQLPMKCLDSQASST